MRFLPPPEMKRSGWTLARVLILAGPLAGCVAGPWGAGAGGMGTGLGTGGMELGTQLGGWGSGYGGDWGHATGDVASPLDNDPHEASSYRDPTFSGGPGIVYYHPAATGRDAHGPP